jgi:ligand-binding SRPBCC domain-containing protein
MFQLKTKQIIPTDLQTCWDFFSSPSNLKLITPNYMGFDVLFDVPEKMYPGLMIEYRVRPIFNLPMKWITEITHVEELKYFVDEQRKGPYRIWHHEHHFKEVSGGVEMNDIVSYEIPFGIFGKLANPIIVQKKLNEIFDYRYAKVIEIFGEYKD